MISSALNNFFHRMEMMGEVDTVIIELFTRPSTRCV